MLATFEGFQGGATMDIAFKLVTNLIALVLMILLGRRLARRARR